jgi:hypothetical protein
MGYRSTVAYTIRFIPIVKEHEGIDEETAIERAKASFYTFLAEAKSKEATALCFSDEELEYLKIDEDKMYIYFFAENVKWYESYPEVACHEALMDLSREWADDGDCTNSNIGGAYAHVGEETEDIKQEVWGEGDYDWVNVSRYVWCDWKD